MHQADGNNLPPDEADVSRSALHEAGQEAVSEQGKAARKLAKLGLDDPDTIILMCCDADTAKCASAKSMHRSWKHLKHEVKKLRKSGQAKIVAIPTQCIGVCDSGPLCGVFPGPHWHQNCDPDKIDALIKQLAKRDSQ